MQHVRAVVPIRITDGNSGNFAVLVVSCESDYAIESML